MRAVEDHLVAGVCMDRAHDAALDRERIIESLRHGGKAVGGAGRCGNDLVIGVQDLLVNRINDGLEVVAGRSGNDDLLGAGVDVRHCFVLGGIEARALEDDVHVQLAPRKLRGVRDRVDGQDLAVDGDGAGFVIRLDRVLAFADSSGVAALRGVVLQKMSQHGGLGQVVDRNDFITLSAEHLTERKASDPTEAIDCNFNCHCVSPLKNDCQKGLVLCFRTADYFTITRP